MAARASKKSRWHWQHHILSPLPCLHPLLRFLIVTHLYRQVHGVIPARALISALRLHNSASCNMAEHM